jgi:hypothetical protein
LQKKNNKLPNTKASDTDSAIRKIALKIALKKEIAICDEDIPIEQKR